ncbi:MAG: hypothetical protein PVI90_13085 [Desulfobacteraceae bacterium]|jgi:hypothetical protein
MGSVTVNQWKEVFSEIGMSDNDMQKWHQCFEKKYPDGHQDFLEWLGLEKSRIEKIRKASK